MRKFSLLTGIFILLLALQPLGAESADDFLKAYFLIQEGDAADKGGDSSKAVEKYADAIKILRAIKNTDPSWNPNIIAYRSKWCADHILKNGGSLPPEEATPAAPAASGASATAEGPKAPVDTVPKGALPAPAETPAPTPPAAEETSTDDRIQALLKENRELKEKLSEAEKKLAAVPTESDTRASLRAELAEARAEIEKLKKENEDLRSENESIKKDLEETRDKLKTATGSPAAEVAPEALQTLRQENALLRSIVERQYQEDAKRTSAGEKLSNELKELAARADSIKSEIEILQTPLTPLTDAEKELLKTPPAELRASPSEDANKLVGEARTEHPAQPLPENATKLNDANTSLASEAKQLFASGDMEGAAAKYEKISETQPNNLIALSNLGVIRYRQGKLGEAESALRGALNIDPDDGFSLSVLGVVLFSESKSDPAKLDEAIRVLTRAIAVDPKNPESHNFLGNVYSQKGYQEAAEKELRKAIELKPDYPEAHFNLAVIYASQNPPSLALAREEYKKALEGGINKDPDLEKLLNK